MDRSGVTLAGRFTFADGRYTATLRASGTLVATVPLACYPAATALGT